MTYKDKISDLAILGGKPLCDEKLHVGRPNIGNVEELSAMIKDMLDRRWLSNYGPYVQEFERRICDLLNVSHCIAICNGTVGLEVVIRALGMSGEVIVPSFTFIATAHALQWQEITPVFADINLETHNLDIESVLRMITPRTTGIVGVHLWGRPCAISELSEICRERNLKLVFDAAHAFECSYKGSMIGGFGDAEVFSFHATKFLNTFEGGAVVTNNDDLAKKIRLMTNFGFSGYDNVVYLGTNGKMSEVAAIMGICGLDSKDHFTETNCNNYIRYGTELKNIGGVKLISYDRQEKNNFQYIILEIDEGGTGISRDLLMQILHAENILARRYFYPGCHKMEPYRSYFPHAGLMLPNTEELCQRVLLLPTGTSINDEHIAKICHVIRYSIENSERIESVKQLFVGNHRTVSQK